MSHDATNWAIKQRGLKPSAKLVLWHLCDRYHPDHGCFPSKDTLASDTELSVRAVYDQIKILRDAGLLIVEEMEKKGPAGKWTSNRYILGCDPLFAQHKAEPSAKSADGKIPLEPSADLRSDRRQILPTNPVKEPVKEPCVGDATTHTVSDQFEIFWETHPRPSDYIKTHGVFSAVVEGGADPAQIIKAARLFASEQAGNGKQYIATSHSWLANARWKDFDGVVEAAKAAVGNPDEIAAGLIRQGKPFLCASISPARARGLVAQGMVTADECSAAGVRL